MLTVSSASLLHTSLTHCIWYPLLLLPRLYFFVFFFWGLPEIQLLPSPYIAHTFLNLQLWSVGSLSFAISLSNSPALGHLAVWAFSQYADSTTTISYIPSLNEIKLMRALVNLDLSSEYQTHIFIWLHIFSWLGCPMGTLHRELIFLAFLIHISVNGITIFLGLLLHEILASVPSSYIQALTRGGQLPTSAPSPPVPFFDGLIARSHHYLPGLLQ